MAQGGGVRGRVGGLNFPSFLASRRSPRRHRERSEAIQFTLRHSGMRRKAQARNPFLQALLRRHGFRVRSFHSRPGMTVWNNLDCFRAFALRNDANTRPHLPATRSAPESCTILPFKIRGRRECRVLEPAPAASCAKEKAHEILVTTGSTQSPAFPARGKINIRMDL